MPYDYRDVDPSVQGTAPGATGPMTPQGPSGQSMLPPLPSTAKYVRVEAWIPAKILARHESVTFRVPFCGPDYQASQPLSFYEPTVTRMGSVGDKSVFRIVYPLGFGESVSVELDPVRCSTRAIIDSRAFVVLKLHPNSRPRQDGAG